MNIISHISILLLLMKRCVKYKGLFSLEITGYLSKKYNHYIYNYFYFNHILIHKTL